LAIKAQARRLLKWVDLLRSQEQFKPVSGAFQPVPGMGRAFPGAKMLLGTTWVVPRSASVASQEHSQKEEILSLTRRLDYVVFNKAYFRGESAISLKSVRQPFYPSVASSVDLV
jgi:hypothetical protein